MRKKKLTDNLVLKIVSLIIGFLIWLIVINVDNPTEIKVFTIQSDSVELLNTAYIDSYNKMCLRDENPVPIRVTVSAPRKALRRVTIGDISVVADMQQAVSLDTSPVMVPVTATCSSLSNATIRVNPQYLSVWLEDKVSQEYMITPSYGDSRPGRNYEVGTQTVTPEKVKITGPKSLINKIDKVIATVNVDGKTKDTTEEALLTIIDRNQDVLSESRMANLTIENGGRVMVTTKFWRVVSGIRFFVAYEGLPAKGYQVESVTTVPDTISLAGTEEALENLRNDDNTLWLTDEALDLTGRTEDLELKISLPALLPEGTRLTTGSSEDVYVTIEILPKDSHAYYLPSNEIRIRDLADGLQASFETDSVAFRVQADSDVDIEDFDISSVKAAVNLDGLTEGDTQVPVEFWLPKGYSLLQEVTAGISISQIMTVEDNAQQ